MTESEPVVRISLKTIFDQGQQTRLDVAELKTTVQQLVDQRADITDLERRLRVVEGKVAAMWVVHGLVTAAVVAVVAFVLNNL